MINNSTPESKLDEAVKTTLNNYEAPFDAADWSRMESMLDAAPKQSSFSVPRSLAIVAASIAVIGGGYLIYNQLNTAGPKTETAAPVIENKATPPPVVIPKATPPPTATSVTNEAVTTPPAAEALPTAKENVISKPVANEQKIKEEKIAAKETKLKKEKDNTTSKGLTEEDHNATQKVMGMGNEPIFGDMLDSSKGIVGETREKEETKKAAKSKKGTPVGWDAIMFKNVNPDSLRKYREKRDSLKAQ